MNSLVIIPARGGSKGVPRKNVKLLNGVPLINYTVGAALKIFPKQSICVSTDDLDIIKAVEDIGLRVPFKRPENLATDNSTTQQVLLHALQYYEEIGHEISTIILLQPTSPFRNHLHIEEALNIYNGNKNIDMVVSVKTTNSNPYYVLFEEDKKGFLQKSKKGTFTRRQDIPDVYEYNGAIYIINVASLKKMNISEFSKVIKYQMDQKSSHDIDTVFDWKIAELLIDFELEEL